MYGGFIQTALSQVFDLRKNEAYWPTLEALVDLLWLTLLTVEDSHEVCLQALRKLVSESDRVIGVMPLLMASLRKKLEHPTSTAFEGHHVIEEVLAEGLTYGPVYRKDQTQMALTNMLIASRCPSANSVEGSDHLITAKCRQAEIVLYTQYDLLE